MQAWQCEQNQTISGFPIVFSHCSEVIDILHGVVNPCKPIYSLNHLGMVNLQPVQKVIFGMVYYWIHHIKHPTSLLNASEANVITL